LASPAMSRNLRESLCNMRKPAAPESTAQS
jgi:hypothetical protein